MGLFKMKRQDAIKKAKVEAASHKETQDAAFAEAMRANKNLAEVLNRNGFTVKIVAALGGKHE